MTIPTDLPPERPRRTGERSARVGGRSERVVRDVLRAATEELARAGYAALRVEDVAARAGVNKTTVYRRWPTKADLVGAVMRSISEPGGPPPDTGSVRDDLMQLLQDFVERVSLPEGRTLMRVFATELDHPEVEALANSLRDEVRVPWLEAIARAIGRGALPAGSDARLIVEMILGTTSNRLKRREPADEGFLGAVVELVIRGAKAGGAIPRS
jgi:AcrR family transcriptional regulator